MWGPSLRIVSFHHKASNHTDPIRVAEPCRTAECWAPPGDYGDQSAPESLLRQGTLSGGPSSRPLGPRDQAPQTPRLILAPSPGRTDWQSGTFCSLCSLTISQFQTPASWQDTGNFHKDTNKGEGCNFCRNCWYKPVCSGMLFSQGASQAALGGLPSLLLPPDFPSCPKGEARPPPLSRRRASVKAQPSGDTEKGESNPTSTLDLCSSGSGWLATPHPPNRLCGTEELLWPWPQALHVWDMSWPSDLQKTLHLQEPDLKWESQQFPSYFFSQ